MKGIKKKILFQMTISLSQYIDTNRTFETNDNLIFSNKSSKIDVNNLPNAINSNNNSNFDIINENNKSSFHTYKQEKNSSLMGEKYFTHVTASHAENFLDHLRHYFYPVFLILRVTYFIQWVLLYIIKNY